MRSITLQDGFGSFTVNLTPRADTWAVYCVGEAHDYIVADQFPTREEAATWMARRYPNPEHAYLMRQCG